MKKFTLTLVILCLALGSCSTLGKQMQAEQVVYKVEKFLAENERLPDSLSELGLPDSEQGPVYYQKQSESRFLVWYGERLGESVTYDSDKQRWE